jgi:hypothetical protein
VKRLATLMLAAVLGLSALPAPAPACPNCRDAITESDGSNPDGFDPAAQAQAYNHSIYLMLSMPYLLTAVVGLMIYRSYRRAGAAASE